MRACLTAQAHQRVMASRRFRLITHNGPVRLSAASGGVAAFKLARQAAELEQLQLAQSLP